MEMDAPVLLIKIYEKHLTEKLYITVAIQNLHLDFKTFSIFTCSEV